MRAINLLPPDSGQRKSIRSEDPAVVVGSALGLIVLIALVAGFMNVHGKVNSAQAKLDAAREELAQLSLRRRETPPAPAKPKQTKPIIPVPAVTSEEQPRLQAISSALSARIAWDRILREFSLVLPDDVQITSLALTAPAAGATTGAPAGAPTQGLSIAGSAFSHDGVARFLSRLMLIPDLTNVTLSSSTAATTGPGVQFSISAGVKGAPAPPPAPAPVAPAATAPGTTTTTGATS